MILDGQEKIFSEYQIDRNGGDFPVFKAIFELKFQSIHRNHFSKGSSEWALYGMSLRLSRDQENIETKCIYYLVIGDSGGQPFSFYIVEDEKYKEFATLKYSYNDRKDTKIMQEIITNFWINKLKLLKTNDSQKYGYDNKKRYLKPEEETEFSRIHRLYLPKNCCLTDNDYLYY